MDAISERDPSALEAFELRYDSLFIPGRAFAFPCDARGHVDLDALSAHARNNYLFVRTLVGRDFSIPNLRARERTRSPTRGHDRHDAGLALTRVSRLSA